MPMLVTHNRYQRIFPLVGLSISLYVRLNKMKKLLTILILSALASCAFSQNEINSSSFLPLIGTKYTELFQTIEIDSEDGIIYIFHKYSILTENGATYFISETYNSDTLRKSYLKEEITKKGLRFIRGTLFEHDSLNIETVHPVSGRKKITFPFIDSNKLHKKKIIWKNVFDNKVIVKSQIEFLYVSTATDNEGEDLQETFALSYKRTVKMSYKKEYDKEETIHSYHATFEKGLGIVSYERIGEFPLKATVVKSEWKV